MSGLDLVTKIMTALFSGQSWRRGTVVIIALIGSPWHGLAGSLDSQMTGEMMSMRTWTLICTGKTREGIPKNTSCASLAQVGSVHRWMLHKIAHWGQSLEKKDGRWFKFKVGRESLWSAESNFSMFKLHFGVSALKYKWTKWQEILRYLSNRGGKV